MEAPLSIEVQTKFQSQRKTWQGGFLAIYNIFFTLRMLWGQDLASRTVRGSSMGSTKW